MAFQRRLESTFCYALSSTPSKAFSALPLPAGAEAGGHAKGDDDKSFSASPLTRGTKYFTNLMSHIISLKLIAGIAGFPLRSGMTIKKWGGEKGRVPLSLVVSTPTGGESKRKGC